MMRSRATLGGTINDIKVYHALLSQTGTNAPVATVLENTLGGDIVYTYSSIGNYKGTLAGAFPAGKTFISFNPHTLVGWGWNACAQLNQVNANEFFIFVDDGTILSNGGLDERISAIQILVYA